MMLKKTISGGVSVNTVMLHVLQENLPFGGVGNSGLGHYHAEEGFQTFSKMRPIFYQSKINGSALLRPPYGKLTRLLRSKGAQNGAYLQKPDLDMFLRLNEASNGLIRIADIAPELPGAIDYIEKVSKTCRVSIAHTDANYEQAKAAIAAGATHVIHLFNAMPQMQSSAAPTPEELQERHVCDMQ